MPKFYFSKLIVELSCAFGLRLEGQTRALAFLIANQNLALEFKSYPSPCLLVTLVTNSLKNKLENFVPYSLDPIMFQPNIYSAIFVQIVFAFEAQLLLVFNFSPSVLALQCKGYQVTRFSPECA